MVYSVGFYVVNRSCSVQRSNLGQVRSVSRHQNRIKQCGTVLDLNRALFDKYRLLNDATTLSKLLASSLHHCLVHGFPQNFGLSCGQKSQLLISQVARYGVLNFTPQHDPQTIVPFASLANLLACLSEHMLGTLCQFFLLCRCKLNRQAAVRFELSRLHDDTVNSDLFQDSLNLGKIWLFTKSPGLQYNFLQIERCFYTALLLHFCVFDQHAEVLVDSL